MRGRQGAVAARPADRQRARRPGRDHRGAPGRPTGWAADEGAAQPRTAAADLELRRRAAGHRDRVLRVLARVQGSAVDRTSGSCARSCARRTSSAPRSPVRIAGVEVGKVEKVERGEGDTSIVTLALEDDAPPDPRGRHDQGAPAHLPRGQLLRRPEARHARARRPSDEGYTIPVAQTAAPVQLDQILLDAPDGHAREPQAAPRAALGEGFADGGAQSLNEAWKPSDEAFTQGALAAEAMRGTAEDDLPEFFDAGGAHRRGARPRAPPARPDRGPQPHRRARSRAGAPSCRRRCRSSTACSRRPALRSTPSTPRSGRRARSRARRGPALQAAPETLELAIPVLAAGASARRAGGAARAARPARPGGALARPARARPDRAAGRRHPGHGMPARERRAHAEDADRRPAALDRRAASTASCSTAWSAWRARRRTSTATVPRSATTPVRRHERDARASCRRSASRSWA